MPEFDYKAYQAELWAKFPYERLEVPGAHALDEWLRLRDVGRGVPVVVGDDENFLRIAEGVVGFPGHPPEDPESILRRAKDLTHPDCIFARRDRDAEETRAYYQDIVRRGGDALPKILVGGVLQSDEATRAEYARYAAEGLPEPEVGQWPEGPLGASLGLYVAQNVVKRRPHDKVHIVLLPTHDACEAPAYLRWGGWNECPSPEYHVAAMRSWRERYGAEVAGMSGDVLNLRVTRRPATREEALSLAREQYAFCSDIVDQGCETLSYLAASLMGDDWWFFWWD